MKGLFIPEITAEMFRNGCIESIEALMAEGEIYDIEYSRWIPITSRPMTEEEKEHYKTHPEYLDGFRIFNCKLPDDGQEVLISVCGGVEIDTFVQDANDGCYFEGRDIDDVDAWMPLPLPYKQEVEE